MLNQKGDALIFTVIIMGVVAVTLMTTYGISLYDYRLAASDLKQVKLQNAITDIEARFADNINLCAPVIAGGILKPRSSPLTVAGKSEYPVAIRHLTMPLKKNYILVDPTITSSLGTGYSSLNYSGQIESWNISQLRIKDLVQIEPNYYEANMYMGVSRSGFIGGGARAIKFPIVVKTSGSTITECYNSHTYVQIQRDRIKLTELVDQIRLQFNRSNDAGVATHNVSDKENKICSGIVATLEYPATFARIADAPKNSFKNSFGGALLRMKINRFNRQDKTGYEVISDSSASAIDDRKIFEGWWIHRLIIKMPVNSSTWVSVNDPKDPNIFEGHVVLSFAKFHDGADPKNDVPYMTINETLDDPNFTVPILVETNSMRTSAQNCYGRHIYEVRKTARQVCQESGGNYIANPAPGKKKCEIY